MPVQTLTINYTPEGRLSILDAETKQPLYHVKVSRQVPQMEMIRLDGPRGAINKSFPEDEDAYYESRVCTAQFKLTSLDVKLRIRDQRGVELKRKGLMSTSYSFISPALSVGPPVPLSWKTDFENNSVGNYKLIAELEDKVIARFRNETFSNERVGFFDVETGLDELVKDEAVISCLAMLAMNQSFHLAGMVMFKGA